MVMYIIQKIPAMNQKLANITKRRPLRYVNNRVLVSEKNAGVVIDFFRKLTQKFKFRGLGK